MLKSIQWVVVYIMGGQTKHTASLCSNWTYDVCYDSDYPGIYKQMELEEVTEIIDELPGLVPASFQPSPLHCPNCRYCYFPPVPHLDHSLFPHLSFLLLLPFPPSHSWIATSFYLFTVTAVPCHHRGLPPPPCYHHYLTITTASHDSYCFVIIAFYLFIVTIATSSLHPPPPIPAVTSSLLALKEKVGRLPGWEGEKKGIGQAQPTTMNLQFNWFVFSELWDLPSAVSWKMAIGVGEGQKWKQNRGRASHYYLQYPHECYWGTCQYRYKFASNLLLIRSSNINLKSQAERIREEIEARLENCIWTRKRSLGSLWLLSE